MLFSRFLTFEGQYIFQTVSIYTSERCCPCGHYEYNNSSMRSFWSKIWAIEGPNYAQFSIFATVKFGFYHKFISLLWQNYSFDRSEIVVLDTGLMNVNLVLYRKYFISSWNSEKPRISLFKAKKREKMKITSNFAEFSRTPL